jgi:hypothetical protein
MREAGREGFTCFSCLHAPPGTYVFITVRAQTHVTVPTRLHPVVWRYVKACSSCCVILRAL